ncbi:hypothetical protein NE236_29285 [Actinoallomurus purpureus]|uniref:hypothetical protein n=1 Tax=Actinoallomurus purpureus TaxID=478114 RepID=UPI00209212C3|nr:hypothetical protein [Actinoallomurus purpureus]MCO6009075.1 hypothetical protein [Actinoallomurus purpureus]
MLRVRAGWVAAVLLIALAFLGGPDLLTGHSHTPAAAATSAAERDHRAGDELDSPDSVTEHLTLGRRRVPGLPPSQNTRAAAATGHNGVATDLARGSAGSITDRHPVRHRTGCSPESLQVFRC